MPFPWRRCAVGGGWLFALAAVVSSLLQSSSWPTRLQQGSTTTAIRSTVPLRRRYGGKKADSKKSRTKSNVVNTTTAQSASVDGVLEEKRPPLDALIDGPNITNDVQFLLDFAIVGHPKTATTTMMYWLRSHYPHILMPRHEVRSLMRGKPAALVQELYDLEEPNTAAAGGNNISQHQCTTKRGYKSPIDLETPRALDSIRRYWPQTKLIVGLRHPVHWFESFYNFHVRHGESMPPPSSLMGACSNDSYNVCTDNSLFHIHLSYLGKTINNVSTAYSADSAAEKQLLAHPRKQQRPVGMEALPNKVFLYEISQLTDRDNARSDNFRLDLSQFLGLEPRVLQPQSRDHVDSVTPDAIALDICRKQHARLRAELVNNGRAASEWIEHHFLRSPDVTVSSPEHFVELLRAWRTDPCDEK